MASGGTTKKLRKPYTITKSRDRWIAEEHERFLDALVLFGRDWKKIEDFVGTKTTIQIRSHAQKYFLKVQKTGLAAHVPPPHPKRKAAQSGLQNTSNNDDVPLVSTIASVTSSSTSNILVPECSAWGATSNTISYKSNEASSFHDSYTTVCSFQGDSGFPNNVNVYGQNVTWIGNSSHSWPSQPHDDPKERNPCISHPVPDFAQVYSFIGSMLDPNIVCGAEVYMEKLKEMDPLTTKTALIMMRNLAANLCSPEFMHLRRWLSTYDPVHGTIASIN